MFNGCSKVQVIREKLAEVSQSNTLEDSLFTYACKSALCSTVFLNFHICPIISGLVSSLLLGFVPFHKSAAVERDEYGF